jgi:predicted porin
MKKLLIATAALAMVAGTAQAQSSVTVYGVLDQSIGNFDNGADTNGAITANASNLIATQRLGFRGTEDLGGGLKANFVIEGALANGVAAQSWNRATFAELTGSFGSVKLGWTDLGTTNIDDTMSQAGNLGAAMTHVAAAAQGVNANSDGLGNDNANGIVYTTPNFNGFTVELGYKGQHHTGLGDAVATPATATDNAKLGTATRTGTTDNVETQTGIRVDYSKGPLKVAIGQTKGKNEKNAAYDRKLTAYGASYDFGVASVGYTNMVAESSSTVEDKYNLFSVKVPMKNGIAVHGVYQTADRNAADYDATGYTLAVTKAMSKRTTVYGQYSAIDNSTNARYGMRGTGAAAANGAEASAYSVGVLHTF